MENTLQNNSQWNNIEKDKSLRLIKSTTRLEEWVLLLSYVYVIKQKKFVDMDNPENTFTEKEFNQSYEYLKLPDNRYSPSTYVMELNKETNVVTDLVMDTSTSERIVSIEKGLKALNLYKPTRDKNITEQSYSKPNLLLQHILWLCNGDDKARLHLLRWMAHLIFKPSIRMNHGIILSGYQGTGKTFLANCVGDLVGKENFNKVSTNELKSQFQHWMISKRLIIVEEVREQNNFTLYNKIKGFFTEERIYVNRKHETGINIDNYLHFFMLSNYANPIPIDKDDRRIFYIHSKVFKKDQNYYGSLNKWWKDNGLLNFKHYLKTEILPSLPKEFAFDAPYQTADHRDAGIASVHPVKEFLTHQLDQPESSKVTFFKQNRWFEKKDFETYLAEQEEIQKYIGGTTTMGGIYKECNLIIGSRRMFEGRKVTPCYFESSQEFLKDLWGKTKTEDLEKIRKLKVNNQFDHNEFEVPVDISTRDFEEFK